MSPQRHKALEVLELGIASIAFFVLLMAFMVSAVRLACKIGEE
jgi:hypothetical protein